MELSQAYKATPKTELGIVESLLKTMLEANMVDRVLGATAKKSIDQLSPVTIENAGDIGDMHLDAWLAFDFAKTNSAAKYIHKSMNGALIQKVGAFGRPCDARALVELHKRRQVDLENILLIGIEEHGRIDPKLAKKFFKKNEIDTTRITKVKATGSSISLEVDGAWKEFPYDATIGLGRNCANCSRKAASMGDIKLNMLTDDVIATAMTPKGLDVLEQAADRGYIEFTPSSIDTDALVHELEEKGRKRQQEEIDAFRALSTEEKMKALGKCTMCGMCINSCPVCFCVDCIVQRKRKEKTINNFTYQLTRISHIADTCVQCGRCDAICPVNLPLNVYFNDMANKLEAKYGYVAGRSLEEKTPRSDIPAIKKRLGF